MIKYALILSAILSLPAQAFMISGNILHDSFQKSETNSVANGFVKGYVAGVYDSYDKMICAPSTVNLGQITEMVGKYLEFSPSIRHLPADVIIAEMLSLAFPCNKAPSNKKSL